MKKKIAWITSIVLFIELFDTTIIYTCFIPISKDFSIDSTNIMLPILSYVVGTCICIPMVKWLSSQYNNIGIVIFNLTAFSIFSLLCGFSSEIYSFSFFRFLQGISISISATAILIALLSICSSNEIVRIMGIINIPAILGTAIGPFSGGILTIYFSWRAAFLLNIPLSLLLIIALSKLRAQPEFNAIKSVQTIKFDWLGFLFMSTFLIMTSIGFQLLNNAVNRSHLIFVFFGLTFFIIYIIIWKIRQHVSAEIKIHSILDLQVFKNIDFLFGSIVNIISRSAVCGIPILISLVLQQLYNFSILISGLYLAVIAVASILGKLLSIIIEQVGVRRSVIISSILTSLSILSLSFIQFWILHHNLWIPFFLFGFFMSLLYTSMNSVLYITLKTSDIPNASNIGSIIQQFCVGLGIAIALGGFHSMLNLHKIYSISDNPLDAYEIFKFICWILAGLIMLNSLLAIPYNIYHKIRLIDQRDRESNKV